VLPLLGVNTMYHTRLGGRLLGSSDAIFIVNVSVPAETSATDTFSISSPAPPAGLSSFSASQDAITPGAMHGSPVPTMQPWVPSQRVFMAGHTWLRSTIVPPKSEAPFSWRVM